MIAVLGLGGVGGVIAVHTRALCVGSDRSVAALQRNGLQFSRGGVATRHHLEAVPELDRNVDAVVVCVKAPDLPAALKRLPIELVAAAVVVPLLNGLEHVATLRSRFPDALVVAASIGRLEAHAPRPGVVVQEGSADPVLTVASDDVSTDVLRDRLRELAVPGLSLVFGESEAHVLWSKAARMAVMSAATAASGGTLGEVLTDSRWSELFSLGLDEAAAVARAHGAPLDADQLLAFSQSLPPEMTTSLARDVSAGRPTELDAITGSVLRAARAAGLATPALDELFRQASDRATALGAT